MVLLHLVAEVREEGVPPLQDTHKVYSYVTVVLANVVGNFLDSIIH